MQKQISSKIISLVFAVLVVGFLTVFYVFAWTEPSVAPPGGNVPVPLNVSNIGQTKIGGLALNTGPDGIISSDGAANGLLVYEGNVGIGTTSPGAKLEVAGQVKITDGSQGAGKVLTSDANGLASWQELNLALFPHSGQTTSYDTGTADDPHYTAATSFTCDLSYTDNSDGTVTDNCTGLMWQKCSMGQDATTCAGVATTRNWQEAIDYCEGLDFAGHIDWRLPNIKELFSLVLEEYSAITDVKAEGAPYINQTVFPTTISSYYWSSTTYPDPTSDALYVAFFNGRASNLIKTHDKYVRCVRGQ